MHATDAIRHLLAHFTLIRAGADWSGALDYDLTGSFDFSVAEVDPDTLRLVAPLPELAKAPMDLLAPALLAANLQGEETGMGQIALHPDQGLALVEIVDTRGLDIPALELRIVNFTLFAEYWRSDGAPALVARLTQPTGHAPLDDEVRIRL
jgi:hypothetical protein